MVNFAAKHFRKVIELGLWINLIGCAIAGLIIGDSGYPHHPFIGLLLGLLVGVLTSIAYGGLIAVFLNIDKGVKNMNKWLQCMWQHHININTDEKKKLPQPFDDDYIYYFE